MESSDRTAEIEREYTDQVFEHPLISNFDMVRKFAVEKASGEWIIMLDADEMIPRSLAETLVDIAKGNKADIVDIPFRHYIMGEYISHSGWGQMRVTRFFKKSKVDITGVIHNYIKKDSDARILRLDFSENNSIFHFNYLDSAHFVEKLNRYTGIEAQHLFESKKKFSYYRLLRSSTAEFYHRFLRRKGYKGGVRGFSLSLMMAFYRALSYVKLWEKYEFMNDPPDSRYNAIKRRILQGWGK